MIAKLNILCIVIFLCLYCCSGYIHIKSRIFAINKRQLVNNRYISLFLSSANDNYRDNKKGGKKPNDNIKQMKVARLLRDEISDIVCSCDIKVIKNLKY